MSVTFSLLLLALRCVADQPAFYSDATYNNGDLGKYVTQTFLSNPKVTEVPIVNFMKPFTECDDGSYLFIAPRGVVADSTPMILDASGSPIWAAEKGYGEVYNLQVQQYKGQTYLTFWGGNDAVGGHGIGQYYMFDQQYKQQFKIKAANRLGADLHAFTITTDDTALISIYDKKKMDISAAAGKTMTGWIWDSIFQELDIETGEAVFEWRASEHVDVTNSYTDVNDATHFDPWDVYHINSIEKDAAGNYLISIRFLRAILYIDGKTGDVLWQLGGKANSFTDLSNGAATTFLGQHDAHWQDDAFGQHKFITLFDNRADWYHAIDDQSKGTRVEVNLENMEARLDTIFTEPNSKILSTSQGSLQVLPNGHVLLGYGYNGVLAEFSAEGEMLCSAYLQPSSTFGSGDVQSYRNLKFNWTAFPDTNPDLVLSQKTLYMSWNGATEVDSWLVLGYDSDELEEVTEAGLAARGMENAILVGKTGFETEYLLSVGDGLDRKVRVAALDKEGRVLGTSDAVTVDYEYWADDDEDTGAEEDSVVVEDLKILIGFGVAAIFGGLVILAIAAHKSRIVQKWRASRGGQDAEKATMMETSDGFAQRLWRQIPGLKRKQGQSFQALSTDDEWEHGNSSHQVPPDLSRGLVAQAR